jgi:uncharacterized membrane protein (Fun14 family)
VKKVMKIAAVVIGLFVAGLAYLSYREWVAIEDASRSTLTNASEQVAHAFLHSKYISKHPRERKEVE